MAILGEQVEQQLRQRFAERLTGSAELRLYTKPGSGRLILPTGLGCATCEDARQLAEAVRDAAPENITLEVIDVSQTGEHAVGDVEDVPMLTVGAPGEEHRIRFMGLTSGFEFATLVDAIERVSRREVSLSEKTLRRLEMLQESLEVMVFATPT
jgi:alkyl hydroperoxide reductase subunit AhpF